MQSSNLFRSAQNARFHPSLTFLGTSSGGGPTVTRNCTATALTVQPTSTWLVDCAEGTTRQLLRTRPRIRNLDIDKVFITHMHPDHCMGLISLLRARLSYRKHSVPVNENVKLHIYGPKGLRKFVRTNLELTYTSLGSKYAVHELLLPRETPTPCNVSDLHESEGVGEDVYCDPGGMWHDVCTGSNVRVAAAHIKHRVPCLGYVFSFQSRLPLPYTRPTLSRTHLRPPPPPPPLPSTSTPLSKVVILGDTSDPSAIAPLAMDADILVHESTIMVAPGSRNADEDPEETDVMYDEMLKRGLATHSGHSTPDMAAGFANRIRAKSLYLNHLSSKCVDPDKMPKSIRYQASEDGSETRYQGAVRAVMSAVALASKTYSKPVTVAHDLLNVPVPYNIPSMQLLRTVPWVDNFMKLHTLLTTK
ncbi:Metallo-hydrolase/oxidoreductase [Dentipellis sp. KUC8613]|nr:Metallo-hydrolase/oxidoreductase [Dentipellis sp. KUC8613]